MNELAPEAYVGTNAGKIWSALKDSGEMTAFKLSRLTELSRDDIFAALGWLAREGKVAILDEGSVLKFRLVE